MSNIEAFTQALEAKGIPFEIRDGKVEVSGGSVDLHSLTTLPEGVSFNNSGYVDLASLATLPEGVSFNNSGSVDLRSLATIPEGVSFNNSGSVYLASLTTLPEGVSFNNSGYVYLASLTSEQQHYRGEVIRLRHIDASTMLILSERSVRGVTICRAAYFGGGDLDKLQRCYIAQVGEYTAHGDTIGQAIRDARFKAMQENFDPIELATEIIARGTVRMEEFRLITRACESGTRHGMSEAGLDPSADELPLDTVLSAAFGSFGDTFRAAINEARSECAA